LLGLLDKPLIAPSPLLPFPPLRLASPASPRPRCCRPCSSCQSTMPNLSYTHPRKYGPGSRTCRVCGNTHGLIRKYGINMCRRCFREKAVEIGFKKMS
jgi:small subunit ribosomal protein S29e